MLYDFSDSFIKLYITDIYLSVYIHFMLYDFSDSFIKLYITDIYIYIYTFYAVWLFR